MVLLCCLALFIVILNYLIMYYFLCTMHTHQTVNPDELEEGEEGEEDMEVTDIDDFTPPVVMKPALQIPGTIYMYMYMYV